jgi:hypothetical protein
MLDEGSALRNE